MKKYIRIIILSVLFLTSYSLMSQETFMLMKIGHKCCLNIGAGLGFGQYRGSYQGFRSSFSNFDYNLAYNAFVRYNFDYDYVSNNLHRLLDKRASVKLFFCSQDISSREENNVRIMTGSLKELSLIVEYNIFKFNSFTKLKNNNADSFSPYLQIGATGLEYKITNKALNIYDDKYKFSMALLFGGGLKLAIFNGIILQADGAFRLPFKPIDGNDVSGATANFYYNANLSLVFNFSEIFYK